MVARKADPLSGAATMAAVLHRYWIPVGGSKRTGTVNSVSELEPWPRIEAKPRSLARWSSFHGNLLSLNNAKCRADNPRCQDSYSSVYDAILERQPPNARRPSNDDDAEAAGSPRKPAVKIVSALPDAELGITPRRAL